MSRPNRRLGQSFAGSCAICECVSKRPGCTGFTFGPYEIGFDPGATGVDVLDVVAAAEAGKFIRVLLEGSTWRRLFAGLEDVDPAFSSLVDCEARCVARSVAARARGRDCIEIGRVARRERPGDGPSLRSRSDARGCLSTFDAGSRVRWRPVGRPSRLQDLAGPSRRRIRHGTFAGHASAGTRSRRAPCPRAFQTPASYDG